jgi:hypothetical protein
VRRASTPLDDFSRSGRGGAYSASRNRAKITGCGCTSGVMLQDPLLGQFTASLFVFEQAWSGSDFPTILIE